jgi:hypothetical protein
MGLSKIRTMLGAIQTFLYPAAFLPSKTIKINMPQKASSGTVKAIDPNKQFGVC